MSNFELKKFYYLKFGFDLTFELWHLSFLLWREKWRTESKLD
jgi:hypothetical protein